MGEQDSSWSSAGNIWMLSWKKKLHVIMKCNFCIKRYKLWSHCFLIWPLGHVSHQPNPSYSPLLVVESFKQGPAASMYQDPLQNVSVTVVLYSRNCAWTVRNVDFGFSCQYSVSLFLVPAIHYMGSRRRCYASLLAVDGVRLLCHPWPSSRSAEGREHPSILQHWEQQYPLM